MPDSVREFHRPADAQTAAQLIARSDLHVQPLMRGPRLPHPPPLPVDAVVDLSRLGLDYVTASDGLLHIGAATPLSRLADSAPVQALADGVLSEAARLAGASGMREVATVGGAVLQQPEAAAGLIRQGPPEVALTLLALDAELTFRGPQAGARPVTLAEFFSTGGMIGQGELLAEVRVAEWPAAARGALTRVARTPRDQAIVAAVAIVYAVDGQAEQVRLAVAGAGPRPQRLAQAEQLVTGQPYDQARLDAVAQAVTAAVEPEPDYRASAEYRRAMAGVLVRRALAMAWRP